MEIDKGGGATGANGADEGNDKLVGDIEALNEDIFTDLEISGETSEGGGKFFVAGVHVG